MVIVVSLLGGMPLQPAAGHAQEATPKCFLPDSPPELTDESANRLADATAWLVAQQAANGGFPGFSGEPDAGATTDAVMALCPLFTRSHANGEAIDRAIAYLEAEGMAYAATGPGQAAKVALAAIAGGKDPRAFGGEDLVARMTVPLATPVPGAVPGIYGDDLYDHALVIIALGAAGEDVPDSPLKPLRVTQGADGGWAFDGSTEPGAADSNTTALVIQALRASGRDENPELDAMIARALPFLASLQAEDGGFAYGPADPLVADANSTALVIQALIAAGEKPSSPGWGNATQALAGFQTDSGGFRYLMTDEEPNLLATLQAIPAMAQMPLPVATTFVMV